MENIEKKVLELVMQIKQVGNEVNLLRRKKHRLTTHLSKLTIELENK